MSPSQKRKQTGRYEEIDDAIEKWFAALWVQKQIFTRNHEKVCIRRHLQCRQTGLFYRATPDGTLCYEREQLSGSKNTLDRITVLVCANIAVTDNKTHARYREKQKKHAADHCYHCLSRGRVVSLFLSHFS